MSGETTEVQSISEPYIREYERIDSSSSWEKAECLSRWRSETRASDQEIGEMIGSSRQLVNRYRLCWEDYGCEKDKTSLSFTHYSSAVFWDDANEWLARARKEGLSPKQMISLRAIQQAAAEAPSDDEIDCLPRHADDEPGCTSDEPSLAVPTPPPAEPAKTAERKTDKAGKDLPPRLRDTFEKGARLESPCRLLGAVLTEINSILTDTPEWANPVLHNRKSIIQRHIENARAEIAFSTPHAVCPVCNGQNDKCKACNGTGWVCADNFKKVKTP